MEIYGTLQPKNNINGGINVASIGGGGGTSDFDTKIIPYDNRIKANEQNIESLQSNIDNVNVAIENHTEQIANLVDGVNYLEEEVESLTDDLSTLDRELDAKANTTDVPTSANDLINDSEVDGATVKNALDFLNNEIKGHTPKRELIGVSVLNVPLIIENGVEQYDFLELVIDTGETPTRKYIEMFDILALEQNIRFITTVHWLTPSINLQWEFIKENGYDYFKLLEIASNGWTLQKLEIYGRKA